MLERLGSMRNLLCSDAALYEPFKAAAHPRPWP